MCAQGLQLALPLLEPPPENFRIAPADAHFESTWLARLVEEATCPSCRGEIKIFWYGGQRW
jgi:hypothetical protein